MVKAAQIKTILIGLSIALSTQALAKKSRREGFNFGSGVKILSSEDRTLPGSNSDRTIHTAKETEAFSPFVAFSTGTFNLGIKADIDNTLISERETTALTADEVIRMRDITTSSGSLFVRFLFAEILFMEGGMGIYHEKQHINNTATMAGQNGSFLGAKDEYQIEGAGPGYHVGAGFEIATGGGFYFNGTYLTKIYRINEGDAIFGRGNQRAYQQKREVAFGLAYYYN